MYADRLQFCLAIAKLSARPHCDLRPTKFIMSRPRSKNSLLVTQTKVSQTSNSTDELASMKYKLDEPSGSIYPLDSVTTENFKKGQTLTYPDFQPWRDHTQLDDVTSAKELDKMTNSIYLNKGLFEAPQVSNEYYTGRNLIQATVFSSGQNCVEVLRELSQHLSSVYKTRNEVINKIRYDSNNFKLPNRVTLTSLKRDAWLSDLANPDVSLTNISLRIPHGIKNKVLVEVLCSKNVPITRAIWFTKCVLYGDSQSIRRKASTRGIADLVTESYELQWLQEWSLQVMDYLYRFSREFSLVSSPEKKSDIMSKLHYLLKYIQTLYLECLIDKTTTISSVVRFFKEGLNLDPSYIIHLMITAKSEDGDEEAELSEFNQFKELDINIGQRLIALLLQKIFWNDIIKLDYLCKDLSEALLLNYYFISDIPIFLSKNTKISPEKTISTKLKESLLTQISDTIRYLFKLNSNSFIIPNYWLFLGRTLYDIVLANPNSILKNELEDLQKQLQMIQQRNESLMLNMRNGKTTTTPATKEDVHFHGHKRSGSFPTSFTPLQFENMISPEVKVYDEFDSLESDLFINRDRQDVLRIIDSLDKIKFNDELAKLLRPNLKSPRWRLNMSIAIMWCICNFRDPGYSSENILMFCGFIKHRISVGSNPKSFSKIRASVENTIFDVIYGLLENENNHKIIDFRSLFVLINELYQVKVITISAYLRKLIASGIFFKEPGLMVEAQDNLVNVHLSVLRNLPVLNNKQCDSILKKWGSNPVNFSEMFQQGQEILNRDIIEKLKTNTLTSCLFEYLENLEVGIKYLLVNWMTNEIKGVIRSSNKLIHIRILTLTILYQVYSACDNLAVFFKVVVKHILKNEGKILMLDVDALYLIALLMIKHFKLIKTISGGESGFVGYEVFHLIMTNYKDFASRELIYLNFQSVWEFVSNSFDTRIDEETSPSVNIQRPATVPQFIFSKATVDSPMKLSTRDTNISKVHEELPIHEFNTELDELLNKPRVNLTASEVSQSLTRLKLNENADLYQGEMGLKRLAVVLFDYLLKFGNRIQPDDENTLIGLLVNVKQVLTADFSFPLLDCFSYFLQKSLEKIEIDKETQRLGLFTKKLVYNEIISMGDITQLMMNIFKSQDNSASFEMILYDLVIGDEIEEATIMTPPQHLMLQLKRTPFYLKYGERTLEVIMPEVKKCIDVFPSDITGDNEQQTNPLNPRMKDILKKWIMNRSRSFMKNIKTYLNDSELIQLLNKVSDLPSPITNSQELLELTINLNEFNLPFYQIYLRLIIVKEFVNMSELERFHKLDEFLKAMIPNFQFQFSSENSFFGELFNLMPCDIKSDILSIFSSMFLSGVEFCNETMSVRCSFGDKEILPILFDFFKKFSISSVDSYETTTIVFEDLSKYLVNLLNLLNFNSPIETKSVNLSLFTFIRIVIIYKELIAKVILNSDLGPEFLVNLRALLSCKYLEEDNGRLKILLYDLMLIFKNLVGVELSDEVRKKAVTSPTSIPTSAPEPIGANHSKIIEKLSTIFDLPDIDNHDILQKYLNNETRSPVTLETDEVSNSGDFQVINNFNLRLIKNSRDSVFLSNETFNILGERKNPIPPPAFKIKSFEILENTDPDINNGRINLLLFDAYVTKQNPP